MVKNLPALQETRIQYLSQKDPWRREEFVILTFLFTPVASSHPSGKSLFLWDWPHVLLVSGDGLGKRDTFGLETWALLLWAAVLSQTLEWLCSACSELPLGAPFHDAHGVFMRNLRSLCLPAARGSCPRPCCRVSGVARTQCSSACPRVPPAPRPSQLPDCVSPRIFGLQVTLK